MDPANSSEIAYHYSNNIIRIALYLRGYDIKKIKNIRIALDILQNL